MSEENYSAKYTKAAAGHTNQPTMSRIGKQPITIPNGVTVTQGSDKEITVKGSKGELKIIPHEKVNVEIKDKEIIVTRNDDERFSRSLHGLTRALIQNMVTGTSEGFEKKLEIKGVGYRAQLQGKKLVLNLGYSHPIEYTAPEGVTIEIDQENKNLLTISGIDKEKVGQTAAVIRGYKKPEPYKGKGIRYQGEKVQRKSGKAAGGEG